MGWNLPPGCEVGDIPGFRDEDVDQDRCERCRQDGIGFNEDGVFLCEDCLFEEAVEQTMGPIVDGEMEE